MEHLATQAIYFRRTMPSIRRDSHQTSYARASKLQLRAMTLLPITIGVASLLGFFYPVPSCGSRSESLHELKPDKRPCAAYLINKCVHVCARFCGFLL
uniref:Col_cuticle_N domain-containing protein n=1 Tax=Ascaris lumbricoides TaxID=6252 RepID=A0A0M3HUN3_ASCLU